MSNQLKPNNMKADILNDNDFVTLICGDLNDEESLYEVLDKCKANGITLEDILAHPKCDKYCTERGCNEEDVKEELEEFFL